MLIGIDGHTFSEKEKMGVATYAFEVAKRLIEQNQKDNFVIYSKSSQLDHALQKENSTIKCIKSRWGWTQWRLSLEFLVGRKPDVMLFFAHSLSRYLPTPGVVAIHDLAFLKFPQYFTKEDLKRLTFITKDAVLRSKQIVVPSVSTRDDMIKYYSEVKNIEKKTTVIPLGYEKELFYPRSSSEIARLRKKFNLKKPYFLYTGSLQPRKNVATLVEAFEKISSSNPEIELVIAGGKGWLSESTLRRIETSPIKDKIKLLGYIDRNDLPALYSGAISFVLPSLYEGFGMPLLEAMACGTPVIFGNNSSLIEIGKESGMAFESMDDDSLAKLMSSMISDKEQRKKFISKGINAAQKYSWDKTAEGTIKVLRKAVND